MSRFHSVPQKLPTLDSAWITPGLFNIAHGLPVKQDSPGAHSSPMGHGKLMAQSLAWSSHEVPQKFVLIIGAVDGDSVDGVCCCGVSTGVSGSLLTGDGLVGFAVDVEMLEATGSIGEAMFIGFALGFGVGFGVGCLVVGLGGVWDGGGGLLATAGDSYCSVQMGALKHPSLVSQNFVATPPGQGLLSKHLSIITA